MKRGSKYGLHRVIEPEGCLPQAALRISNDMTLFSNEILIDVQALNIDSASFRQLSEVSGGDRDEIGRRIMEIVAERGKMQNPVTGSGGMLIGTVAAIGDDLQTDLQVGDKVATLVSLSLTPLRLDRVIRVHHGTDRIDVAGQAILFESGLYAKLPHDLPEAMALAALDVAGAPAQMHKLIREGDRVLIIGAGGKSGLLSAYAAKEKAGPGGFVAGCDLAPDGGDFLLQQAMLDRYFACDATDAPSLMEKALAVGDGREYDVSVLVVNVPGAEMSAILPVRDEGTVYFFSMATSFTKAALGAEGIGKDVSMLIGNGYTKGHADFTLGLLRRYAPLRQRFADVYC